MLNKYKQQPLKNQNLLEIVRKIYLLIYLKYFFTLNFIRGLKLNRYRARSEGEAKQRICLLRYQMLIIIAG